MTDVSAAIAIAIISCIGLFDVYSDGALLDRKSFLSDGRRRERD